MYTSLRAFCVFLHLGVLLTSVQKSWSSNSMSDQSERKLVDFHHCRMMERVAYASGKRAKKKRKKEKKKKNAILCVLAGFLSGLSLVPVIQEFCYSWERGRLQAPDSP